MSERCIQVHFILPDGTKQLYAGIFESKEQADALLSGSIREGTAPSTKYVTREAMWPDDWRKP